MCGIIGYASLVGKNEISWLLSARDMMLHRGPDNGGVWFNQDNNIVFGHRRLSIIDINEEANQPMIDIYLEETFVLTFNGEIYNYIEIRSKLIDLGITFKTNSDTEVLIKSYLFWGEECINIFDGMFAFVIFDPIKNILFFGRDIAGEKPFYYFIENNRFYFSSEFLPLISHPSLNNEISLDSVIKYLEFGFLHEADSFNHHIKKLPSGSCGTFCLNTSKLLIKPFFYFQQESSKNKNITDYYSNLDDLINRSVSRQLTSDVPVGVLLSGGIDSSIISCTANSINSNIVNYTVDFGNNPEEINNAKIISKNFNAEHVILPFEEVTIQVFDEIISKVDEPVADSSFIPTFLISKLIYENGCKVVLGGDGADELFGGYSLYKNLINANSKSNIVPGLLAKGISNIFNDPYLFNNLKIKKWLVHFDEINHGKIPNIRQVFSKKEIIELFYNNSIENYLKKKYSDQFNYENPILFNMSTLDFKEYLGANILLKNDRASMLNSIEMRAPFLSKSIVNFAFNELPDSYKINDGINKKILIEYSKRIFPLGYKYNPKRGFNFTENLLENREWNNYFFNTIKEASIFNINYIKFLIDKSFKDHNSFLKIYSLYMLSKWVLKNNFKIKDYENF